MDDKNTQKDNQDESWVRAIPVCPICGSNRRFFESIGEELKQRGLFSAEMKSYYEMEAGPFGNQDMMAKLPIGASLPAFGIGTDICLGYPNKPCGCIYAVRIERSNAKKTLPVPLGQLELNRQQRRHGGNGDPGFNLGKLHA